jgi:hypothetical protein
LVFFLNIAKKYNFRQSIFKTQIVNKPKGEIKMLKNFILFLALFACVLAVPRYRRDVADVANKNVLEGGEGTKADDTDVESRFGGGGRGHQGKLLEVLLFFE